MTLNRYDRRFATLRETGQKAFIPFTMLGWPDRDRCLESIRLMIESGASALELGMALATRLRMAQSSSGQRLKRWLLDLKSKTRLR
ncbi:MAG TPA: tryptophan synthase subunit alpha [Acidobacteriota bacterium]|nr:tryptophan synthase subunit alpha [Acidobacteriota bacterium]